jgi:hypothetical protein
MGIGDIHVLAFTLPAHQSIATDDGNDLAYNSGFLNCRTWNIYK